MLARCGRVVAADWGLGADHGPRCYLNTDTLALLAGKQLSVEQSIQCGRVVIEGPPSRQQAVIGILKDLVSPST
jgi:hypothetical protein